MTDVMEPLNGGADLLSNNIIHDLVHGEAHAPLAGSFSYDSWQLQFCHFRSKYEILNSYVDFKMCTYLAGSYTYGSSELHFCHLRPKTWFYIKY